MAANQPSAVSSCSERVESPVVLRWPVLASSTSQNSIIGTCVAGPAAAQLVVSSLLFEDQGFVDDAVANLVAFTLESTHIMVHVSRGSRADAAKWDGGRVHVASDREETCSSCGMVSRMHAANVRRAASLGLSFSHVALFASSCRLFSGGGFLERHVARHNFSAIQTPGWARTALLGCGAMTPGKRAACERGICPAIPAPALVSRLMCVMMASAVPATDPWGFVGVFVALRPDCDLNSESVKKTGVP